MLAPKTLFLRRYAKRHIGYLGARCPMCFGLTHHRIWRLGLRTWVGSIVPLPARYLAYECQCLECGVYRAYQLSAPIAPRAAIDPEIVTFTAETNSGDLVHDRIGFAYTRDEILSESLDRDQRHDAIFQFLDGMRYEGERAHTLAMPCRLGVIIGFLISYTVMGNLLLLVAMRSWLPANSARPTGTAGWLIGLGGIISMMLAAAAVLLLPLGLWLRLTRRGRAVRKRVMPRLVAALVPLYPTEQELAHFLEELRNQDLAIGKVVRAKKLAHAIEVARLKAGWEVRDTARISARN